MLLIYILLIIIAIGVFLISEQGRQILRFAGKWGSIAFGGVLAILAVGGIVAYVIHNPSAQSLAAKLTLLLLIVPFLNRRETESLEKLAVGVQKNDPKAIRRSYWLNKFVQAGLWFIGIWTLIVLIFGFFAMLDNSVLMATLYVAGIVGFSFFIYFLSRFLSEREKRLDKSKIGQE